MLSIILCCFFEDVSMVTLNISTTIDYNNILIKAQLNYIATVSAQGASETHSKRRIHIKVSERYYSVFALS